MRAFFSKPSRAHWQTFGAYCILGALVLVTAIQLVPLIDFVPRSVEYIAQPRDFHLARRWKAFDYFNRTQAIVAQTPPDALIVVPAQSNGYGPLGNAGLTDYFVFPRQVANVNASQIKTFSGPVYQVSGEPDGPNFSVVLVRERRAETILPVRDFILIPRAAAPLALAAGKFLFIVLSGAFWVRKWFHLKTMPGALAASALSGMTINAVVFMLLALLGIPAREILQNAILGALALPALFNLARHRPHMTPPQTRAEWLAAGAAFGALALIFFLGISKPLVEWDALAIWGIKARAIFATETLRTLGMWGAYPEYPPLVPIAMAQLGVGGELAVKALFPLFAWCLYGVVHEGLEFGGPARWLAPLPLLFAPQIGEQSGNGYANLALTVYVTLAVILLARWTKAPTRAGTLALAFTLSGLVLVRPDGEIYAAYVLALALYVAWKQRVFKRAAFLIAAPLACDALWKIFFVLYLRAASGSLFGVASQGQQFLKYLVTTRPPRGSILPVMQALAYYSFGLNFWGLIPIAFVLMFLIYPRTFYTRYPTELAFLILSGSGLALLAVYLAPRWGIDYFFNATYLRFYMAIVPLVYLVLLNVLATQVKFFATPKTALVRA